MPLAELLTRANLRARAGYSYERGERYWKQGRVGAYVANGEQIVGIVAGSDDYHVRLIAAGRRLESNCTCPVGGRGEFCKHAVALALHHVEAQEGRAPIADDTCFATRRELEAWAEAHRVEFELDVAADAIVRDLEGAHPSIWQVRRELCLLTLREVGSLESARRIFAGTGLQLLAAQTVKRRVQDRAAEVETGLAEERVRAKRWGWAPREEATGTTEPADRLREVLGKLRREQREQAAPRSRAARAAPCAWQFHRDELAIEWHEPLLLRGRNYASVPLIARLAFDPEPQLTCACGASACTHAIALIDATLDRLEQGDADAHGAAEEVARPAWQRALAALAAVDDVAKPRTAIEVWWEVEHELRVLTATPIVKRQLKKGGMSPGTRITASRLLREHGGVLDARDREVAEQLDSWYAAPATGYPVKALGALVGHPRVTIDGTPVTVRRFPLGLTAIEAGANVRLEPSVDGTRFPPRLLGPLLETFPPGEPLVVLEPEHGRLLLIDVGDDARRIWAILAKHGDTFPPEAHGKLFERLAHMESKLPVAVPPALLGDKLVEPPTVVLRLRLQPDASLELEPFIRPAAGAPLYPPGIGPRDVMIVRAERRCYARRDLDRERELVAGALARLPLETAEEGPPGCYRIEEPDAALAVVAVVQSPPEGVVAEWVDARPRIVASGGAASMRVQIDTKRDWFGIAGELKVEQGRIELAVLLDAARRQQRFVRIDDHRWVELESTLRARLADIADRTFESRGNVELSVAAAPAIRALADAGAQIETVPAWQRLAENLAAAGKLRPKPPAALTATLRPYQVAGHAWLARLAAWGAGACLADDMGLGKTVQAIALLCDRAKLGPAIVLAPTSVCLNWVDELRRFAPTLHPVVYGEAPDRVATLAQLGKRDILIASYGLLARDADALARVHFATLVADEAQALKNPRTERAKAARGLVADFRVAMSGTPLENHLGELWSLFALIFPGLLGSWEQFRTRFAVPIEKNRNPEASAALARVIKPFLLRRTKQEVAPELPPRTEIEVPVALSSEESELYEDARLAAVANLSKLVKSDADKRRFEVLAALTRLRLLASHPKLYDHASSIASSKMQRLLELVEELRSEGHRALVFSQFTSHLALVRAELEAANVPLLYLDGSTPAAERARLIARFQAGDADVFLISLKAGGTGINLTGADYVIHLDPWWNPAVEDQATDRAHRIGQDKPVTVYRLIARNTVEEKILAMHGTKRALVKGVLEGTDAAARLTTRDLVELISAQA